MKKKKREVRPPTGFLHETIGEVHRKSGGAYLPSRSSEDLDHTAIFPTIQGLVHHTCLVQKRNRQARVVRSGE